VERGGSRDLFLAKFAGNGAPLYGYAYGDENDQLEAGNFESNTWAALELDAAGNMYIGTPLAYTATFDGVSLTSAGKLDFAYVVLSPDARFLGGEVFGGSGSDLLMDIAVTDDRDLIIAGRTYTLTTLSFGRAGAITGQGSADAVLVKLNLADGVLDRTGN